MPGSLCVGDVTAADVQSLPLIICCGLYNVEIPIESMLYNVQLGILLQRDTWPHLPFEFLEVPGSSHWKGGVDTAFFRSVFEMLGWFSNILQRPFRFIMVINVIIT